MLAWSGIRRETKSKCVVILNTVSDSGTAGQMGAFIQCGNSATLLPGLADTENRVSAELSQTEQSPFDAA